MLRFPVPGAPLTPTDNERTLARSPSSASLKKAASAGASAAPTGSPSIPQHCAAEIGLNLRHVKLSESGDTAELEAF